MNAAHESAVRAGFEDIGFLLLGDPRDPTFVEAIITGPSNTPTTIMTAKENSYKSGDTKRHWEHDRYREMVSIRNLMLDNVREMKPDLFLSLDTDMLLHPNAILEMSDLLDESNFDAIGGKAYMSPNSTRFPSYGMHGNAGGLLRPDTTDDIEVDVIMAIKLMTPAVYNNIDYHFDTKGEDIGWSDSARKAGFKLGWCGAVVNEHVMKDDR